MEFSPRQSEIAALVQTRGVISVMDLSARYGLTTQTIRRDVNRLCTAGVLRRVHGGVAAAPDTNAYHPANLHYGLRQILNLEAKQDIARRVAAAVPDQASVALSIGTTPEIVMRALLGHQGLRIFTNNLNVAMIASDRPTLEVTIVGGRVRAGDRDILGAEAERFFSRYRFDIGIFGVAGVDEDGALLDFHEEEVAAREAIQRNSRRSFLVLDQSKFGRPAHVRGGAIETVDRVFCDRPPPAAIRSLLAGSGVKIETPSARSPS